LSNKKIDSIFLDTNIYESAKFEYIGNKLEKLFHLCKKHDIAIYTNTVIQNEILHRIKINAYEAVKGIKKEQLQYISKVNKIPHDKELIKQNIEDTLVADFKILETNYLTTIPCEVDTEDLLKMYFEEEAPFNVDNKKSEFPDAIMLLSIRDYSEEHNINILVLSNDGGVQEFCKTSAIQVVNFVSEALGILNEQFQLNLFYSKYKANIESRIKDYIKNGNIHFNIYGYDFEDTVYAEKYDINNIAVSELFLIEENDDLSSIIVSCPTIINFTATTNLYPDYENGTYDKEDGLWFAFSSLQTTFIHTEHTELSFEISILDFDTGEFDISYEGYELDIEFDLYSLDDDIVKQEHFD